MAFSGNTIQRKLVQLILLISAAVLLLAGTIILSFEFRTFRQTTLQQASTLGAIVAGNSTASLAFENADDAAEILSALRAEQLIVAAGLYKKDGTLFAHYPPHLSANDFPALPKQDGYRFSQSNLLGFQAVMNNEKRLGTLYLKWDLKAVYDRFVFYGAFIIISMSACLLAAAYSLSRTLHRRIAQPLLDLADTAKAVSTNQDYSVRARHPTQDDELGLLTNVFNQMLERIQAQNTALTESITERKQAAIKIQTQLSRMELLERITRATADRQDLRSIFQVTLVSLERDLPIDFGCVCTFDEPGQRLTVACVGTKSEALSNALGMTVDSQLPLDANGLSTCVKGNLVYEPDVRHVDSRFPRKLAEEGLYCFVAAPLTAENKVFGVLVVARSAAHAFSSPDCEFIRQLSEHVALAGHQVMLYRALQDAYDDLRQTQQAVMQQERLRALGQMASGIAHDINNAISPIALYTESMLEKEPSLSPRARGYLAVTQKAIEDVAQTIARMREFYRERESPITLVPVQLNDLVHQVVDLTRARWSDMPLQRGIVIRMVEDLTPEVIQVMGVEAEIREALVNLVFNSVDAMPDGGTITIHTSANHDGVTLEVSDTGTGMDEATRRRCLEPFFTTKGERGTGLGLAMVYGTVQRHRAEVLISSEVGKGTSVRLTFPQSALEPPPSPAPEPARSRALHVLLVDDDSLLIRALTEILERDGHEVIAAPGGREGIETFEAHLHRAPFELVITDLGMPHIDGAKVAAHIKERSPQTPVILFTGWGQRIVADNETLPNVDRVLNKPPRLQDLRTAIVELAKVGEEVQ